MFHAFKFLRNSTNKGFTIVEALVSISIIGIIVAITISQQKLAVKNSFTVATDAEINNLTNNVIAQISDQATCSRPTAGLVGNFGGAPFTKSYDKLLGRNGEDLLVKNIVEYGSSMGKFTVNSITTRPNPTNANEIILNLSFHKNAQGGIFSSRDVTREIILGIDTSDGLTIDYCYGNYDLMIKTAIQLACQGNSSFYDSTQNPPYGACIHLNQTRTCPNGEFLKAVGVDGTTKEIQYVCASMANACPTNQFITEFRADGSVACGSVLRTCAPGQLIVNNSFGARVCTSIDCTAISPISAFGGFNAAGAAICNQITSLQNCGTDNFATQVNTDGSITCNPAAVTTGSCPVGQFIQGITAVGTISCAPFINLPIDCGAGRAITGIDVNGNATCTPYNRPLGCGPPRTYKDCLDAGGTIGLPYTADSMCLFNSASCPGGWTRCANWGSQVTNSCTDIGTAPCIQTRYAVPLAGDGFQNNPQTSMSCFSFTATTGPYGVPWYCAASPYMSVSTIQTQVGCY